MLRQNTCLSPYTIECPQFPDSPGPIFIDHAKTRRIVTIISPGDNIVLPVNDAILMHEEKFESCEIRWYECPTTMGRIYTLSPGGCQVSITSFENGFFAANECDGSSYGTESFCFGKIYTGEENTQIFDAADMCGVSFDFDGHNFRVKGHQSEAFGLFDCGICWPGEEAEVFAIRPDAAGEGELPAAPKVLEPVAAPSAVSQDGESIIKEDRIAWDEGAPEGDTETGTDVNCNQQIAIKSKNPCESQDNPAITMLSSGQAIIAYEDRNESGQTSIKLMIFNSSVGKNIKYYRTLSRGILINDADIENANGTFEIFDDLIDEDMAQCYLGFLNGPLKGGSAFSITAITRDNSQERIKHTINFTLGGRQANFGDSNNASDISWFIISASTNYPGSGVTESLPIASLLDLPPHIDSEDNQLPVSAPSVTVAHNNIMTGTDQHIYVAYQVFESGQWNVYLREIRVSDKDGESPTYLAPYEFSDVTFISQKVTSFYTSAKYTIVNVGSSGNSLCALMQVSLMDESPVFTENSGIEWTSTCILEYDAANAYIQVVYDTTCGSVPNWTIGNSFISGTTPLVSDLGLPSGNNESCMSINYYPASPEWLFGQPECTQFQLIDEQYCPSPYLALTYHPEDLYTLTVDNDIITRVIYHMAVSTLETSMSELSRPIDFMFIVDHSGSMSDNIGQVRLAIPTFAQQLFDKGADIRFGLTVFGRGSKSPFPVNPIGCTGSCGDSQMFDGLDFTGSGTSNGFSSDVNTLSDGLLYWGTNNGGAAGYCAIQFALQDNRFHWRNNAKKFIFFITDTNDTEMTNCNDYLDVRATTINLCQAEDCTVILAICDDESSPTCYHSGLCYLPLSEQTGWGSTYFSVNGSYDSSFAVITEQITTQSWSNRSAVMERDTAGYGATFLKKAEICVTYDGDLSDKWSQEKQDFVFVDNVPSSLGDTKGLVNLPFDLFAGRVSGIDSVHLRGDINHWVYFLEGGSLQYDYPNIGIPAGGITFPVLIAPNATQPRVIVNNRNHVFVIYETYENDYPQIEIKGTGDFAQNSITGPKANRITRYLTTSNFAYHYTITLPEERVNQLADIVIDKNDVIHITWQSNRDNTWEIYYANGLNLFEAVRITKADGRSGFPRIDINDDGTIYIVYHDNRFGPYEIMLSLKDDERIIPLLQQDPYLASLAARYTHYTNLLPILITNAGLTKPIAGKLFGTKIASDDVSEENYIFMINDDGTISGGGDTSPYEIIALAGDVTGILYGITKNNKLLLIDTPEEDPYHDVEVEDIVEIGNIDVGGTIVGAACDRSNQLWIMAITSDGVGLLQISTENADIITQTTIYNTSDRIDGALSALQDGSFYIVTYQDGIVKLLKSAFPYIVKDIVTFNFQLVKNNPVSDLGPIVYPTAMTSDFNDDIFVIDGNNYVYQLDKTTGDMTFLYDLTDPYRDAGPYPLGKIYGFACHFTGQTKIIGVGDYFHVLIEFYNNINLDSDPFLTIDSRDELDAFVGIGTESIEDPYTFSTARGIYVKTGTSAYVYFDASLSRPGSSKLAYPYAFGTNRTYFPKVFCIKESGEVIESNIQNVSFSCNRCSRLANNIFANHECSYSFVLSNNETTVQTYNLIIDFFADEDRRDLIRRFYLSPENFDLAYVEVDNDPGDERWGSSGLSLAPGDQSFIQIYPSLDPDTGFICDIDYTVRVQAYSNVACTILMNANLNKAEGSFKCNCSSNIFPDAIQNITQIGRWISSGRGYSDTRVTSSHNDSLRPTIKTRSSGGNVILFENHDGIDPKILGTTFHKTNINELFGSGTKSWFDYSLNIDGRNVDLELDMYDRVAVSFEKPDTVAGQGLSIKEVPGNTIWFKTCDFEEMGHIPESISDQECNIESLEANIITSDPFISASIVKKINVKPEFVKYYTYDSCGKATPTVEVCDIVLQVWGTPELVAVRFRNERDSYYGNWCPATPSMGDNYLERDWMLSPQTGVKEICVQAITYNGITSEFCLPVVADYIPVIYELRIYSDPNYEIFLPQYEGLFVISTKFDIETGTYNPDTKAYIEILPGINIKKDVTSISFDIIQQGSDDILGVQAVKTINKDGRPVFRQEITIKREDRIFNVDGLARIQVRIPGSCDTQTFVASETPFTKDRYNVIEEESEVIETQTDVLSEYRQAVSGRVGVDITIKPTEDPYLVFGDPNFFLKREEPK